jgi:ribonuclease E
VTAAPSPQADARAAQPDAAGAAVVAAPTAGRAPVAMPSVPRFELPLTDLQQIADGAGLQWVHSDTDKVLAVQQAIAAEPKPVHVPRERQPVVLPDEGPLVLVETRKDLSQLALPFERQAAQRPPGA